MKKHFLFSGFVGLAMLAIVAGVFGGDVFAAKKNSSAKKSTKVVEKFTKAEKRCIQLKGWFDENVLTKKLRGNIKEAVNCEKKYTDIWDGLRGAKQTEIADTDEEKIPSTRRCKTLRKWADKGMLTKNLKGNIHEAELCDQHQKAIWRKLKLPKK